MQDSVEGGGGETISSSEIIEEDQNFFSSFPSSGNRSFDFIGNFSSPAGISPAMMRNVRNAFSKEETPRKGTQLNDKRTWRSISDGRGEYILKRVSRVKLSSARVAHEGSFVDGDASAAVFWQLV